MSQNVKVVNEPQNLIPVASSWSKTTVSTNSVPFDNNTVGRADAEYVYWSVEGNAVRVKFDGTAPTATDGIYLIVGSVGYWDIETAKAARFIRAGAADGIVQSTAFAERS